MVKFKFEKFNKLRFEINLFYIYNLLRYCTLALTCTASKKNPLSPPPGTYGWEGGGEYRPLFLEIKHQLKKMGKKLLK
jgi:hypothetical protein